MSIKRSTNDSESTLKNGKWKFDQRKFWRWNIFEITLSISSTIFESLVDVSTYFQPNFNVVTTSCAAGLFHEQTYTYLDDVAKFDFCFWREQNVLYLD